jgi:aspartate/methionine/tyrosine aminotransferase
MENIQPFRVMELLARARALESEGKSIIHMEVGEPDFDTPETIIQAGQVALAEGKTHYTPAVGLAELRQAISAYYKSHEDVDVSADRIIVTPGASGALQLVLGTLIDPGDRVLMADPGYPCNRNFVYLLNGVPVSIPVGEDTAYQLTAAQLADYDLPASKAVLLASPSNPTGTLVSNESMKAIISITAEHDTHLVVDEIYHGLVYGDKTQTVLSMTDDVFVINSFSKYFGMTGWRVGWVVAPENYVPELDKLTQNIFLAAPTIAQYAALAAFNENTLEILEKRRMEYERRRDFLIPALKGLGFKIPVIPQGAFYVYADCSKFSNDGYQFCNKILEDIGVAITPGLDFGENEPGNHVRFAYTTSLENLEEGVRRLGEYLANQ